MPSLSQDQQAPGQTAVAAAATTPASPRVLSARTARFYARDWAAYAAWCRGAGATPLPAEPVVLAAYVTAMAARLSPGAVARRLAAICNRHLLSGLVAPRTDPAVRAALKAVRRNAVPRRDPPPSPALLARIIAGCPGDLAGLRDRALLLLMQATGLGRAGLVSLDAEAVRITGAGCDLRFGEADAWLAVRLTRSPDMANCPVQALEEWLRVSDTSFGPVFRKVDRWGNIEHGRLGADAVRRILARRTPRARRSQPGRGSLAANLPDPE